MIYHLLTIYFECHILLFMDKKAPLYRTIYNDLLRKIETEEYQKGDKIPTELEWAKLYKVSRITSKKALDLAAENHIIVKYPGKGSFISSESKKMIGRKASENKKIVGIIQHDLSDSFGLEIFKTLQTLTQDAGMLALTGISNDDTATEKELISSFLDFGVDGLIIKPVHNETFNNEILKLIIDNFPVVLIDRYLKDVSCPNVVSNNFKGAMDGMKYLYSLGHKKVGIFSRPIGSTTTLMEREKGIMQAIMESGYPFRPEWRCTDLEGLDRKDKTCSEEVKKRVRSFLQKNRDITAIFGLKYSVIPVVEEVAFELGIRIPEDLSLICFDVPDNLVSHIKPLTHLRQNEAEMARRAFDSVLLRMDKQPPVYRQEVEVDLVIGSTTAQVRTEAPARP